MIDVATAEFDEIAKAFPHFDRIGLHQRCRAELANAPPKLLALLDATHTSCPPELEAGLVSWCRNNEEMLLLAVDLLRLTPADAIAEARVRRQASMEAPGAWQDSDELRRCRDAGVEGFRKGISAISQAGLPLMGVTLNYIYRGTAVPKTDVSKCFAVGERIVWTVPTACSIDPGFVPLHFAFKGFANAKTTTQHPAAIVLAIELSTPFEPILLWTGIIKGKTEPETYRWQQEVITPPNFAFEVRACERLNTDKTHPLYRVHGIQVP